MPVYEYQCQDCAKKFDIVASIAEKEAGLKPACPKCGGKRAKQVFSRFTLLTSSKSAGDEFDSDAGGDDLGDAGGGFDGGMDDFDDAGDDDLGGSDSLDDLD